MRVACFYMHARRVGIMNLYAEEHQNGVAPLYSVRESTYITYVAHLDLVGDPLQDTSQKL